MNTDCAFYIGTTHKICQDYALANANSVVVSDGCSGSLLTDIGSRIISVTAINKIKEADSLYNFEEKECILLARPSIKILNLPNQCLDATLLMATVFDYGVQATCCGDGVIAIQTKDKDIIIINCSYTDSYPFYMNYLYDQTGRYSNWQNNHNKKKITQTVIDPKGQVSPTQTIIENKRLPKDIGLTRVLENKVLVEIADESYIDYIAIMSDGIHSFYEKISTETSKYNQSINYINILKELLTFKNYNKAFVQRRINKFRKLCEKNNWANSDDFSLAVIRTEKEDGE
jgi:hypothetical protein